MYDYVHYAETVPQLAILFHMCTWVEWASYAGIDNSRHLDMSFDAIDLKRFNGFMAQRRDAGSCCH